MGRGRAFLLATALGLAVVASTAAPAPGASRGGEIVFSSNRATANPGEIYALAAGVAPRDVSRSPYADVRLATSPRGRAYAFWSNRAGPWRLMISRGSGPLLSVDVGGRTGAGDPIISPVFSGDGTRVLTPYVPRGDAVRNSQYAVVNVDSGAVRRVRTPCRALPAWSPDGKLLACLGPSLDHVSVTDLQGHVLYAFPGRDAVWAPDGRLAIAGMANTVVINTGGHVIARLNGVARAWSPDGRKLALTRPGALVLAEPGHSRQVHVVYDHGNGVPYWVTFTPDGRTIVFAGGLGVPQMAEVAGGRVREFPAEPLGTWSHDGRYAFVVPKGPTLAVEVGDRLGRKPQIAGRLPYDTQGFSELGWLGDGSRVLYETSVRDRSDLWSMKADGSTQHRLTGGLAVGEPAWSADGKQLAYDLDTRGSRTVALADAQGRKRSALPLADPAAEGADASPSWSPSGRKIAVEDSLQGGIWVVAVADGKRTQVSLDGLSPAWSPDGSTIAFVGIDDGVVWGVSPTGANRRRLVVPPGSAKATSVTWSPNGRTLVVSTKTAIYAATPGAVGDARRVIAAREPGRPSFSPDGTRIAFAALAGSAHPYRAVYAVGLDGASLQKLTAGPFDSGDPAWNPNQS